MTNKTFYSEQGFTVGSWSACPASGDLIGDDHRQRLEPKVMQLLVLLAARAPDLVDRDEIVATLWPDTVVGEDALARCLLKLRRALDDDARTPTYIETLPRRGYRLIAPVASLESRSASMSSDAPRRTWAVPTAARLAAGFAVVAILAATAWVLFGPPATDRLELPLLARAHDHYYRFEPTDNERAHLLYQRALEQQPDNAEARAGLANTLSQRVVRWPEVGGPVPEGDRSVAAALDSDLIDSPWARATLARARELANAAVRSAPNNGFAWKAHGLVAALQRDLPTARSSYRRALEADPDSWESAVNLGEIYLIDEDEAGAIEFFVRAYRIMEERYTEAAQRVGPWQPEVGVTIGALYRELGDDTQAEAWFRRVLATTPLHIDATLALAASRAEAGDEQEAETLCRDLVSRIGPLDDCAPYLPER